MVTRQIPLLRNEECNKVTHSPHFCLSLQRMLCLPYWIKQKLRSRLKESSLLEEARQLVTWCMLTISPCSSKLVNIHVKSRSVKFWINTAPWRAKKWTKRSLWWSLVLIHQENSKNSWQLLFKWNRRGPLGNIWVHRWKKLYKKECLWSFGLFQSKT